MITFLKTVNWFFIWHCLICLLAFVCFASKKYYSNSYFVILLNFKVVLKSIYFPPNEKNKKVGDIEHISIFKIRNQSRIVEHIDVPKQMCKCINAFFEHVYY